MNLAECDWKTVRKAVREMEAVMILLGSTEEHGYHLPVSTDTILTNIIAEKICKDMNMCFYPCIVFGQVWSAKEFPGTISISPQTLKQYLKETVECVLRQGAKRIILYSFHNGNISVLKDCIRELRDDLGTEKVFMLESVNLHKKAAHELTTLPWNGYVWHAGELETSLMLYLDGGKVKMDKACSEFPEIPVGYEQRAVHWKEFSKSGVFGDSTAATKEKGEKIFSILIKDLEERVEEIEKIVCN